MTELSKLHERYVSPLSGSDGSEANSMNGRSYDSNTIISSTYNEEKNHQEDAQEAVAHKDHHEVTEDSEVGTVAAVPESSEILNEMVLIPQDSIFLLLMPIRDMLNYSSLLPTHNFFNLCFYVNVPKATCIIGHVANYLCQKLNEQPQELRPVWTYPFTIFVHRVTGEYVPVHNRVSMARLTEKYPFSYKAADNMLMLFYTHGFEMPTLYGIEDSEEDSLLE